jgi:hypothetical protein
MDTGGEHILGMESTGTASYYRRIQEGNLDEPPRHEPQKNRITAHLLENADDVTTGGGQQPENCLGLLGIRSRGSKITSDPRKIPTKGVSVEDRWAQRIYMQRISKAKTQISQDQFVGLMMAPPFLYLPTNH